jgi:hypothetical protein
MAQTGFTPISLYYTTTAAATPTAGNLVAGELAINTNDGKLFYKDSAGVVQTIASKAGNLNVSSFSGGTTGLTPSTATTGVVTLAGTLAVANGGTGGTTSTGSGAVVLATSPTVTTPTIDKINTSVANTSLGAGNASIMKNRIINGAMVIAQRGTSSSDPASGQFVMDRWANFVSTTGKISVSQSSTAPTGFSFSNLITSSSAYSISSTDYFFIRQNIEGFNSADLGWGTANAKTITISFWVRSSLTGTFGGALQNSAQDRSYPFTYTVSSANTWEQKSVTIVGDTTGTWVGATNGIGIQLNFGLGVGSTYSGTAGAWATSGVIFSATGATSVVGTNGATLYITGVQLEVGSSATGYEYRQYTNELQLAQRYYIRYVNGTGQFFGNGDRYSSTFIQCCLSLQTEMRIAPSLVASTGSGYYIFAQSGTLHTFNSLTIDGATTSKMAIINNSGDTSATAGQAGTYKSNNASSSIAFNAEL